MEVHLPLCSLSYVGGTPLLFWGFYYIIYGFAYEMTIELHACPISFEINDAIDNLTSICGPQFLFYIDNEIAIPLNRPTPSVYYWTLKSNQFGNSPITSVCGYFSDKTKRPLK